MTDENRPTDPLAQRLALLAPVTVNIATPEFYFAAGMAHATPESRFWKRICFVQAILSTLAVSFLLTWFLYFIPESPRVETASPVVTPPLELAPLPRPHNAGLPEYQGTPERLGFHPTTETMTNQEIAYFLQLRNEIITVGLNLLPSNARPVALAPERDGSTISPPVFTAPHLDRAPN